MNLEDKLLKQKKCLLALTGAFEADGGIAAVNRLVIRSFAEQGYFLDIFVLNENSPKVDCRYIDPNQARLRGFNKNKYTFTLAVWLALRSPDYEFIFADLVNLASILVPPSKLLGRKYIVWLYGIDVFPPRPDLEGRIGLKHAWKRLAISGYTHEQVKSRFPELEIRVCDLALDPVRHPDFLPPEPVKQTARIELSSVEGSVQLLGSKLILHVGRMVAGERYKGQDTLLLAFPRIVESCPEAQLLLVGQGGDMTRLLSIARSYPLEIQSRIFMPGYVAHELLDQIYHCCYLFAMPSKGEGLGLVYLEAMSRAKPCLGGNVDATPCVVHDGITGLLVDDPTSAEQVATKIIWLLEHSTEAKQMGRAAYELVRSHYLFPHFKERFWQLVTGN